MMAPLVGPRHRPTLVREVAVRHWSYYRRGRRLARSPTRQRRPQGPPHRPGHVPPRLPQLVAPEIVLWPVALSSISVPATTKSPSAPPSDWLCANTGANRRPGRPSRPPKSPGERSASPARSATVASLRTRLAMLVQAAAGVDQRKDDVRVHPGREARGRAALAARASRRALRSRASSRGPVAAKEAVLGLVEQPAGRRNVG